MRKSRSMNNVLERPPQKLLSAPSVAIEYPKQDEVVRHPEYTVRICAREHADAVEVAFDQGDWQPCREALGFWWFDWKGFDSGEHEIVARSRKNGLNSRSEAREFFVRLD